jgi:hypothetical protein
MQQMSGSVGRPRRQEATEFRLIFMASFVIFLMVAIVERFLPSQWRPLGAEGHKSIIGEARTAARTFVPFAFMG